MNKRKEIKDHIKKLLFVEGNDEVNFFSKLLHSKLGIEDIQIYDVGGKDQFKVLLPTVVKQRNFDQIERIGIIQDSDDSTIDRFTSICHHLNKNNLLPPKDLAVFATGSPSIGVFLLPNNSDNGMLESLCLRAVKDDKILECVEAYFECLDKQGVIISSLAKAKAQVYLASQKKLIQQVGIGAKKDVWDFDADCMKDLIEFLNEI